MKTLGLNREIEANYSLIPMMMMKMTTSLFVMMECKNWPWFLTAVLSVVLWKNLTRQYLLKVKHFQEEQKRFQFSHHPMGLRMPPHDSNNNSTHHFAYVVWKKSSSKIKTRVCLQGSLDLIIMRWYQKADCTNCTDLPDTNLTVMGSVISS